MTIYDEPSARRHRVRRYAVSPDRQRPDYRDPRVVECVCGLCVAVIGNPEHRPARLTECVRCWAD